LATAIGFIASAGVSSGLTVLNDGFEIATHPTGFRSVHTFPGSPYFGVTGPAASITDDAVFGSRALTVTAAANYHLVSPLGGTISLANVSDTLTFSFKLRFTNTPAADGATFRFGVFSSNGTSVTTDNFGAGVSDNDQGYYAVVGAVSAAATAATLFSEAGGTTPILGGTDRVALTTSATGPSIAAADNTAHSVSLTITRTSLTQISFSYVFDGGTPITAVDNSANLRTSFDQIAISNGFTTTFAQYNIDDVLLTASNFTPIPEPAAAGLAGIGLLGLLMRRRTL
jgi:hypothetical protein